MARSYFALATLIAVHLMSSGLNAQTGNSQAVSWFNRGLNEKDPQKKIEAYSKALELDPDFVEALFNLGLIYMQQSDSQRAEEFFSKALTARSGQLSSKLKTQILFYLAMINKQEENWPACEANLLEAKKIAQDKAVQTKISSELGRLYFKQQRYNEALQELSQGRELDKASQPFFDNLIQIIEKEMELERLYQQAERLLAGGNPLQANSILQQIKSANPNFKDVQAKLVLTDSLLKARAADEMLSELYQQAARYADEGALQNAIATYEILLQQSPNFLDAKDQLETVKRKFQEQERTQMIELEYAAGEEALSNRNWTRAIIAFEKVLELAPEYSEARKKLAQANRGLQEASAETIVNQFYVDALAAMERGDLTSALAALEKVRHLNPNFKDTQTLMAKIEGELQSQQAVPSAPLNDYYQALYDDAIKSLDDKNWMQAILTLEKLRVLKPDDPNIINLLSHARANLKLASSSDRNRSKTRYSSMVYFGGALAAIVILPALGYLLFSAPSRARWQFLRGNYLAAAQIYERYLTQHPNKVKLYVKLANIYLISGRDDDRALKVFKTLINLNLAPHIHPQINSILAQKYLTTGANNSEAIAVLESALKVEQSKHNQV